MSSSNITATSDASSFSTICSTSFDINLIHTQNSLIFFIGNHNTQKTMTSNDTQLTVAISGLIIPEGISFNLAQNPWFKKVLDLERNFPKGCQPPNRNIISKDILGVIRDQSMERKLSLIKNGQLLCIFISRWWCHYFQNSAVEHVDFREKSSIIFIRSSLLPGSLAYCGRKGGTFICTIFLEHIKNWPL